MTHKEDLLQELYTTLDQVNALIAQVWMRADAMEISGYKLMDVHGNYMLTPLLVVKAQVLSAIVDVEKINE